MATPLLIQWYWGILVGNSIETTKFVECPVVDSVPALVSVLYRGQSYTPVSGFLRFASGINKMTGTSVYNSLGRDSASSCAP